MSLHDAILQADFLLARKLIESGVDVNERDSDRRTPLMLCALHDGESWAVGVARMLLIHGARAGLRDGRGRSALMYAALYGRLSLSTLLLRALGCDPKHVDREGWTALRSAANGGNSTICCLLQEAMKMHGFSRDTPVVETVTPADFFSQGHYKKAFERTAHNRTDRGHTSQAKKSQMCWKDLPYKTIPAKLWKKRKAFYTSCSTERQSKVLPDLTEKRKTRTEQVDLLGTCSVAGGWRLHMGSLQKVLQMQLSSSYRPGARLLPQSQHRQWTPPLLERRLNSRKMSLDAARDALIQKRPQGNITNRRCSVAAIPLTCVSRQNRQQACKDKQKSEPHGSFQLSQKL